MDDLLNKAYNRLKAIYGGNVSILDDYYLAVQLNDCYTIYDIYNNASCEVHSYRNIHNKLAYATNRYGNTVIFTKNGIFSLDYKARRIDFSNNLIYIKDELGFNYIMNMQGKQNILPTNFRYVNIVYLGHGQYGLFRIKNIQGIKEITIEKYLDIVCEDLEIYKMNVLINEAFELTYGVPGMRSKLLMNSDESIKFILNKPIV